jgi:hypothetical protein
MARETDTTKLAVESRVYIKVSEWDMNTARSYWFTGYETVTQESKKTGNLYKQRYIYLLDSEKKEHTLSMFIGEAAIFAGIKEYQKVTLTKVEKENGYPGFILNTDETFLKESERVPKPEYLEVPVPSQKNAEINAKIARNDEINIDDIPF